MRLHHIYRLFLTCFLAGQRQVRERNGASHRPCIVGRCGARPAASAEPLTNQRTVRNVAFRTKLGIVLLLATCPELHAQNESRYFAVQVVDDSTGRGVPLVELKTINHLQFLTDSHGFVAIDEPDLVGRKVYFSVSSHGYEYPPDGFGFRGATLQIEPGKSATLRIKRVNLAERLYRATGSGIYRDSVLLGRETPLEEPLLNAEVFGCDSVMSAIYHGKIHWFWGDTARPHYPIGSNFHISGATSPLPQDAELDPQLGIRYDYFVSPQGAVRAMAEMPGDGPTWISAVTILKNAQGEERMYAGYVKIRNQLEAYRWGFVVWNDASQQFEHVTSFDERPRIFLEPQTHSFPYREGDTDYIYFTNPLPLTRVRAEPDAFMDPAQYESYTCLRAGTRLEDKQLDRNPQGELLYAWKADTPAVTPTAQQGLIDEGLIQPEEALIRLRDVESGRTVTAHSGSVYWNEYRQRWILITVELFGTQSGLGEVWFAEADTPTGPWRSARKIVTHDKYSFYNPKHHPFFDQQGGKIIYFEGTYTHSFSATTDPTPRYDYNQIMYRLDLSHPELRLSETPSTLE